MAKPGMQYELSQAADNDLEDIFDYTVNKGKPRGILPHIEIKNPYYPHPSRQPRCD